MTNETSIKRAIKDYLNIMHIDWFWNLQGLGVCPGLPDMFFFDKRDKKLVFLEVKTPKGQMSENQLLFKNTVEQYDVKFLLARDAQDVIDYLNAAR